MSEILNLVLTLIGAFTIIFASKIIIPEESYKIKLSLIIAILLAVYYGYVFLVTLQILKFIGFLLSCSYIYLGGKELSLKTGTLVFNTITKKSVGYIGAGTNWIDPFFEIATTSVDGVRNKTIELQELKISIPETSFMQTATPGIQVKATGISLFLKLHGNAERLLEIEGGSKVIRERIIEYVDEFFLKKISQILPDDLVRNKRKIIEKLMQDLRSEVNDFCDDEDNKYPYKVTGDVIIKDTQLEPEYYKVLARKEFAKLEQQGFDVEAKMLKARLLDLGNSLVPSGTEHEKLKAAMIALKIVPQSYEQKVFGISTEISTVLKDLALIFKAK